MNLDNDLTIILSVGIGVCLFAIILSLTLILDDKKRKKLVNYNENDWMLKDFNNKIYDIFFKKNDPQKNAKSLGLDVAKFHEYSVALNIEPNYKIAVVYRFYGIIVLIIGFVLSIVGVIIMNYISLGAGMFAIFAGLIIMDNPMSTVKKAATKKKLNMSNDIVRYVDLLLTALQLNLPVDQALIITSQKIKCPLSDEILETITSASLSQRSWIASLVMFANKYNIDALSDLISTIAIAYQKGVSIYEAVYQQSITIKTNDMQMREANAKKVDTAILAPICLLKLAPLIVFMMIPIMNMSAF